MMRFGLPNFPIDLDPVAEAGRADLHQTRIVGCNMIETSNAAINLFTGDKLALFVRLAPVDALAQIR